MYIHRFLTAAAAVALLGGPMTAQALAQTQAAEPSAGSADATTTAPLTAKGDLASTLKSSSDFTILTKALDATNLTPVLKSQPNLTVLAPTDAAFRALPPGELDKLMLPENAPQLQKLLTYHVINARVDAAKIKGAKGPVKTVAGADVQIDGSASPIKINDANVVQADVKATNGEIYVIDKVLMPSSASAEARTGVAVASNAVEPVNPGGAAAAATADGVDASALVADQPVNPATSPPASTDTMPAPSAGQSVPASTMATPAAQSSTDASTMAPTAVPMSSQGDPATWKYGDPGVVANPPIPDTRENRAKYGMPLSNAGRHSRLEQPSAGATPQPQ